MGIFDFHGEDFKSVVEFEGWEIGLLRHSKRFSSYNIEERHLKTDEAFVLLEGKATLYEEAKSYEMEKCKVYNVKKGLWHHIVVSEDATVLVVKNSNTSMKNTERKCV